MQAWKSRPDMAKTRFRNLFRGAKLSSRRPEPKQATQSSPPAKAEQRQLFAEPAPVAEAEVPARASEPAPTVPDAPPSAAQTEMPTKPEPAVERTVGEYASEACSCANRAVLNKPKRCCPKLSSGLPPSLVRESNGRCSHMPTTTGRKPSDVGSSFAPSSRTRRQHTRLAPQGCASWTSMRKLRLC